MSGLVNYWNSLDWSVFIELGLRVIPSLLCITLHELSHSFVACLLGDTTARDEGRLTLNPIRHIDPMGLLMMIVFRFGWAKPVPVNMYRFRNPKRGMAVTALAGPVGNVLICVVFLGLYGLLYVPLSLYGVLGVAGSYFLEMFYLTAYISLAMGIFNLLPIPPLDGSKVLYAVLSDGTYYKLMRYERYGMIVLFALVWSGVLGSPLSTATQWLFSRLFTVAEMGFRLVERFA